MDAAFYLPLRYIHIISVLLSGLLFAGRGVLMLQGSAALRHWSLRIFPHVVDTILLVSALMLTTIIHQYPFVHAWLTVKVLLLVVYIGLGSVALKHGHSKQVRAVVYVTALAVFLFIVSVARSHDPAGIFRLLSG